MIKIEKQHPAQPDGDFVTRRTDEEMAVKLASEFTKRTASALNSSTELVDKAMDARSAMDLMSESWKVSWIEFQNTSDERLKELRMTRMAMDSEMRQLMAGLREVRAFFLDKDYSTEIERLKDFVCVCERLKALKDSGFLDTISETMLRLAIK